MHRFLPWILLLTLSTALANGPPVWSDALAKTMTVDDMLSVARQHMETDPPDGGQAVAWLEAAADAGSSDAMGMLGLMHAEGLGVERNGERAVAWYTRAVEAGAFAPTLQLGWLYLQGELVPRDRTLAERWFRRGIDADYHPAGIALASVLIAEAHDGGPPERALEARTLLEEALEGGVIMASYFLARLYIEGPGAVDADPVKAVHYTRMGAHEGNPQMQGWLGMFYARGEGVEQDLIEAMTWSSLAAAEGDQLGNQLRLRLESELNEEQIRESRERAVEWLFRQRQRETGLVD